VLFGLILTIFSSVIGIAAGAVQGYFGGWTDLVFQRFIEIWTSIPSLYLLIIISSVLAPSFFVLLGILLLFSWVTLVGVVRAEFLRARNFEYVRAARALGLSDRAIMVKHLLPNAMVATLTFLPFILNGSITTLTALDFLGFGLPPGSPSLGELLAQGKSNLQAPWLGSPASSDRADAVAADLHRRGGARRLRPPQDVRVTTRRPPPLHPGSLRRLPPGRARDARRRPGVLRPRPKGETLASSASRARASRCRRCRSSSCCPIPGASSLRRDLFKGQDLLAAR
jgi:ABC-type proline/glycine betaine transport system permease subunit